MCEILTLRAVRADASNTDRHTRALWHQGYIIQVKPDGHPWGLRERLQTWLADGRQRGAWHDQTQLFLLPGEAPDAVFRGTGRNIVFYRDLMLPQEEDDDGNPVYDDGGGQPVLDDRGFGRYAVRRRLWQVSETLPPDVQLALETDGEYTVSPISRFDSFVKRSKDGDHARRALI